MKAEGHPDYHFITVVMTDGTEYQTRSTYGKEGDRLTLDIDSSSHPAWTGGTQQLASDLEYGSASSYTTLSAGGTLQVDVNNQTQGILIDQVSCNVSSGRSYDAIIAYTRFDSDDDQISIYCQPYS